MGTKKDFLKEIDRRHGFTAPSEDYFEQFASRMMGQLPEVELPHVHVSTLWTRIQPWIYMAAMFVGIALMVRIFSPTRKSNEKDILAEEQYSTEYYDELIWTSCVNDYNMYEYLADAYEY